MTTRPTTPPTGWTITEDQTRRALEIRFRGQVIETTTLGADEACRRAWQISNMSQFRHPSQPSGTPCTDALDQAFDRVRLGVPTRRKGDA